MLGGHGQNFLGFFVFVVDVVVDVVETGAAVDVLNCLKCRSLLLYDIWPNIKNKCYKTW